MNIFFSTVSSRKVEVHFRFKDGAVYGFEKICGAGKENMHVIVGRWPEDVQQLLVKVDDYWYDEALSPDMTIKLDGREKYTQMLRDAAMRVKPEGICV